MTEARDKLLARLREPFPPEQIGKLPKPMKKESPKGKCLPKREGGAAPDWQDHYCGDWHGLPAVHLDFVGHAAVTDRLLEVDPEWNWEPKGGWDDTGEPRFVRINHQPMHLWIDLTVLGITRHGVGTVDPGTRDAEKVLIGDAIRNAAMRFGVALDLWIKGQDEKHATVHVPEPEQPKADAETHTAIREALKALGADQKKQVQEWWTKAGLPPISKVDRLTETEADTVLAYIEALEPPEYDEMSGSEALAEADIGAHE